MIRVGVVGFGLGGRVFHAPLVASVEGLELAAIVDRGGRGAAERYPGIAIHRTLDDLLKDDSISLVVITTPSGNHFEAARQAFEAGKNVVIDKPMAGSSAEIAQLMRLAAARKLLLAPFHNRRWDSDFRTIQKVLHDGSLGRLVGFESYFDRWRPVPKPGIWKEDPAQAGGMLLDIGTHLADQALVLFGKPEGVSADVTRERDGKGANDAFNMRLHYAGFSVALGANCLASPGRTRYLLRGTRGNYWKWGLDGQEAALGKLTCIPAGPWGEEPAASWGTLNVDVDGGMVTCPVKPIPGDYRLYYAGIRDALEGKAPAPVSTLDAWRVARLLEWAEQSSEERREIACDWSGEPA
jgi:scyllo-inositol 2-dehydrogenase (NADP+)